MQSIDPSISRQKFTAEVASFLQAEEMQRQRGILLLKQDYPDVIIAFCTPQMPIKAIAFTVRINFDNYDLVPPSIRFIDPFSWENLTDVPNHMLRKIPKGAGSIELFPLAQKEPVGIPFICFPGIREYHNHPAHTGNNWLLHRKKQGVGTLGFLIEKLYQYGISSLAYYRVLIQSPLQNGQIDSLTCNLMPDINRIPE
jgi:hypothetical protein